MGRQGHRAAANLPGFTAAVETRNARGVFDSFDPQQGAADEEEQATLLFRPTRRAAGRHAGNFPPPVQRAVVVASSPRVNRADLAPRAPRRASTPPTLRAAGLSLEPVVTLPALRTVIVATESTPAMALDADSGEYTPSRPTMPVPRMPVRSSKLPFAAAGVLALAAGALVVLFAAARTKHEDPSAWATGPSTTSAALANPAAAAAPHAVAAGQPLSTPTPAPVTPRVADPEPAFEPAQVAGSVRSAPAPKPVAARPAPPAVRPVPAAAPAAPAKPVEPKAPKAAKGAADEEVAKAKADANAAAATLGNSL